MFAEQIQKSLTSMMEGAFDLFSCHYDNAGPRAGCSIG